MKRDGTDAPHTSRSVPSHSHAFAFLNGPGIVSKQLFLRCAACTEEVMLNFEREHRRIRVFPPQ